MKKTLTIIACTLFAFSAQAEWDMFKAHDKNKDGEITKEEWVAHKQKVAQKNDKKFNEKQVVKVFKSTDTDGSGTLSRDEVEALQAKWAKGKKKNK
jgi:Ca2+-binding EF-hand superfamily protein